MATLLTVEDLHIFYDTTKALKGVSLEVKEGEIVAVLGANGAGKSTLLKAISGLLSIRSGDIKLKEEKLNDVPAYKIVEKGVSHVPEGRKVFPTLTVEENLNLGAYSQRKDKEKINQAKERIFRLFPILQERRRQLAGTLSGGEQQMLAIGRGLMSTPQLLLLDEPSLGLAPTLVKQVFETIQQINTQGVSILLVEQNARKALGIANRGYIFKTGRVALKGTADKLRADDRVRQAYLGGEKF